MAKLGQDHPTDLDELMIWAAGLVFFGRLAAVGIIGLALAMGVKPYP